MFNDLLHKMQFKFSILIKFKQTVGEVDRNNCINQENSRASYN